MSRDSTVIRKELERCNREDKNNRQSCEYNAESDFVWRFSVSKRPRQG